MAKPVVKELTDEKISKVLSQGILLTMEDDLRCIQGVESREFKFKKQRESAKIMPISGAGNGVKDAPTRAAPIVKPGFLNKIKGIFKKERKPDKKAKKLVVKTKPFFVSKSPVSAPAPVLNKPARSEQESVAGKLSVSTPIQPVHPVQKSSLPLVQPLPSVPLKQESNIQESKLKQLVITKEEAADIILKRNDLEKEKAVIENQLKNLSPERESLKAEIVELKKAEQAIQIILAPILEREARFETEKNSIEQEEVKVSSIQEKHKLDQKRWSIESQRRKAEQEKWIQEEKIEQKDVEIKRVDEKLKIILDKESGLKRKKEEIFKKLEQAELFEKRDMFGKNKQELDSQLSLIAKKEKEIEQRERILEQKERQAKTTKDRRIIEKQRWELETQRKNIEERRWQVENKKQELQEEVKVIIPLKQDKPLTMAPVVPVKKEEKKEMPPVSVKDESAPLKKRGREWQPVKHVATFEHTKEGQEPQLKQPFRAPLKSAVEIPLEDMSEEELINKIKQKAKQEEKIKKIQIIKKTAQAQRSGPYVPKSRGPISKAQILQKLSTISSKENDLREKFLTKVSGKPQAIEAVSRGEDSEIVFRPVVGRSSVLQKIAARVMFLVLILGTLVVVALLLHTYVFSSRPSSSPIPIPPVEQPEPEPSDNNQSLIINNEPEPEPSDNNQSSIINNEPEPIPLSIIDISETQTLWLSATNTAPDLLSDVMEYNQDNNGFVRVVFRDKLTQEIQRFDEFLKDFNITAPVEFLEGLVMPPTLFIYFSGNRARFGFIAEVKSANIVISSLKSWEADMEHDTEEFFTVLGKTSPAISSKFLIARHGSEGFRYQTFTKNDFGICYAVTYTNYFIFTTSYESMQETLDKLSNQ